MAAASTICPNEITIALLAERAKAAELAPLVEPYAQGFADSTGRGVRNGPVHLFALPLQNRPGMNERRAASLCGRRVKLWNFEGETDTDFCPRCIAAARTARKLLE